MTIRHICTVCMDFMALITVMVSCTRSQKSLLLVSVRRVHVVFSSGGFKGGGKPCPNTCETAAMRPGFQNAHVAGFEPKFKSLFSMALGGHWTGAGGTV